MSLTRSFLEAQCIRDAHSVVSIDDRELAQTAGHGVTGALQAGTQSLTPGQTVLAASASRIHPRNADTIAHLEAGANLRTHLQ